MALLIGMFVFISLANFTKGFRQTQNVKQAIEQMSNPFENEYVHFAPCLISEVLTRGNQQRLYGRTMLRTLPLMVPSPVRRVLHISVDEGRFYHDYDVDYDSNSDLLLFYEIGDTAIEHFNGGFSLLAEMFLNFGYFAVFFFLVLGWWISDQWSKLIITGSLGMASLYAVFPITLTIILLSFRNDFAIHAKMIIQLYIINYCIVRISSRGIIRQALVPGSL